VAAFDIMNPHLVEALPLEVHGDQHTQKLTKERSLFFLTPLKHCLLSLGRGVLTGIFFLKTLRLNMSTFQVGMHVFLLL